MHHLVKYFFRGLLLFVPAVVTVYVCVAVFLRVDRWMGLKLPGAGLLATIALITTIGFLGSNFLTRRVFDLVERLFEKVPVVKLVYSAVRDLTSAFVGERKGFDRPVMVSLGLEGEPKALGFVTRESLTAAGLDGYVAVYMPQAYAVAGLVLLFPASRVTALEAKGPDVMAFLVSGGVSGSV